MSPKREESARSASFEDIVLEVPKTVMKLTSDQIETMQTHYDIISALTDQVMSAEELHHLYLVDPVKQEYSRTMKTLYRHLEFLEEAGLIMKCGFRRYGDKRKTKNLYSRTAKAYFFGERDDETRWADSERGQQYLTVMTDVVSKLFKVPENRKSTLYSLLRTYYVERDKGTAALLEETAKNDEIAQAVGGLEFVDFGNLYTTFGVITTIIQQPDLIERMRKALGKT